jgi:hypothetical protein
MASSSSVRFIAVVVASFALVPFENFALWGYFFQRPSMANELKAVSAFRGLSLFRIRDGGLSIEGRNLATSTAKATRICKDSTNECLSERLILAIANQGHLYDVPDVDEMMVKNAWKLGAERIVGRRRNYLDRTTRLPVAGWAFRYGDAGGTERLLLSYFTGEYSSDRHIYGESLFDVVDGRLVARRQFHFTVDIAGVEYLTPRVLLFVNIFALSCAALAGGMVRGRLKIHTSGETDEASR